MTVVPLVPLIHLLKLRQRHLSRAVNYFYTPHRLLDNRTVVLNYATLAYGS